MTINNHNEQTAEAPSQSQAKKNTEDILKGIIKSIQVVDWHKYLGKKSGQKIKNSDKIVAVVDSFLWLAKNAGHDLCQHNGVVFLYNGEFWTMIAKEVLPVFLGEGAKRMGVDPTDSKYFGFREMLEKQFQSAVNYHWKREASGILINLMNGTLEINSGAYKLKPFNSKDYLTYQLPFAFDMDAKAPIFNAFLDKVLPDKGAQKILAEYIGYLFISNKVLKLEKVLMLVGEGANGKSTFYDVVNGLLGRENVSTFSISKLTDREGYYRAMIGNKLLNYASEIGNKMDTTVFKQLVSGEAVEARLPYGKPMIMENYARFIFNTNGLPVDVEHNHAFFRRFIIIPFEVTIPEKEQDKNLSQKIVKDELPGVLNWVLSGLDRLVKQGGFTQSEVVENVLKTYVKESDPVMMFLEEEGYIKHLKKTIALKEIYSEYRTYCMENGYRPLGNKNFKKRLEKQGFQLLKTSVGQVVFAIKPSDPNNLEIELFKK